MGQQTPAEKLFTEAFDAELADQLESGGDLTDFRAAGKRVTKANPYPEGENETWWRTNGPQFVQAWFDWRKTAKWRTWATPDGEPAIELGVETEIANMPLKMKIDRVMVIPQSDNLCILDLKAGARTPESDLQLGVYRLGIYRRYGVWVDWGAYFMARKGILSPIVNLTRYTEPVLNNWFDQFKDAIENEIFIPHQTNLCRACGLNRYCAAYGGAKSHLDPDSPNYKEE